MNWEDNLILARGLATQPFEVAERAAVSLAYYGAFNLARRWLEANVTPIDRRGAHQQVWQTFKAADRADEELRGRWRMIGRLGDSLRQLRNQVDYDDQVEELAGRTPRALRTAERILQLLAGL
ncbi:MAG TPA: hypothetical protein VMF55_13600 [Solirubrobacterales bacterium]|nr:hypothetical protein [Solirubrobacterales bacterium]